jgi:hypothetical protein
MNTDTKQRHLGRKIWYGVTIALCVLVILLSTAFVVGTWVAGSALSSVAVQVLLVVENTADGLSAIVERIDQGVAGLEEVSTSISAATIQLSQNVTDKGLVLTLLPEQREQELVSQANELQQTLDSVGEALKAGLELYRSIDNMPFVSLPKPEPDKIAKLEQDIANIGSTVQQVVQGIQDFRTGVAQEIDRVTSLLDEITSALVEARQELAQLNGRLEALQALADRLQRLAPLFFTLLSVFATLFFAWIIYGQVEIIRMYAGRWKGLGALAEGGSLSGSQPAEDRLEDQAADTVQAGGAGGETQDEALPPAESMPESPTPDEPQDG